MTKTLYLISGGDLLNIASPDPHNRTMVLLRNNAFNGDHGFKILYDGEDLFFRTLHILWRAFQSDGA